jgi:hypothetical protein
MTYADVGRMRTYADVCSRNFWMVHAALTLFLTGSNFSSIYFLLALLLFLGLGGVHSAYSRRFADVC